VLLQHGTGRFTEILTEMKQWFVEHEYASISQLKGSVSQQHPIDPSAYGRANYVQLWDSYSSPAGVLR
jgi:dihydroorotate dehydrogenase (fumarate)